MSINKGRVGLRDLKDFDLVITFEKSTHDHQRISGHVFEAFDYWLFLTKYLKPQGTSTQIPIAIVIGDDIPELKLKLSFDDKYRINQDEINFEDIPIFIDPFLESIVCKSILHTSGISKTDRVQYYGDLYSFRCSQKPPPPRAQQKYTLLQDIRVYGDYLISIPNVTVIDYVKKIPFEFYRDKNDFLDSEDSVLIYSNTKLRENFVSPATSGDKVLNINSMNTPMRDLFKQFKTYIYTPTKFMFDCSSRLIVECKYYNKIVVYALPDQDNYFKHDLGLYWRKKDTEDNFESLVLKDGDLILDILKGTHDV